MEFSANFEGVASHDLREIVEPLKSVVGLLQFVGIGTGGEIIEDQVFHSFVLRGERHDGGSSRIDETLRYKADADAALWLTQIVEGPQVAEVEFVDRRGTQRLGVTQAKQ